MLHSNNSVVALTDIGEAADIEDEDTLTALFCLTDLTTCCRGVHTGLYGVGEWVLAGQTEAVPANIMLLPVTTPSLEAEPPVQCCSIVGTMLSDPLESSPATYPMGVVPGRPTLE